MSMALIESQSRPSPTATSSVVVPVPAYEPAQFFDFARDLFCVAGLDGYFKLVNASWERVLGYSREELTSRAFLDFVHPDDVEDAIDGLSALATGEDVIGFESRLICADGSVRRFEWNTRTMPHLGVVYGIGRDVTERTALADEQAALRRVATLVARGSSPEEVFAAVVEEVGRIVGVDSTAMLRYEDDETAKPVARWGAHLVPLSAGFPFEANLCSRVFATARPARVDHYADAANGATLTALGVRSAVGAPIIVDGRLWGAMIAVAPEPLPRDTESRMVEFTELVAAAIANVEARTELTASRARIVAAADAEQRRVVRDLHDGAQQRLVHTVITLKLAQRALADGAENAPLLVQEALGNAEQAMTEVRELAHGILPAVLTHGGLRAGIAALSSRTPVPVETDVPVGRLPAPIEATAYFLVAEALTNVAKHASAGHAEVVARIQDGMLRVDVRDDGVGGASPDGTGLVGLADRLAVLDGWLEVDSPPGGGTRLTAAIPLPRPTARPGPDRGGPGGQRARVRQQERAGGDAAGHELGEQVDPDVSATRTCRARGAACEDGISSGRQLRVTPLGRPIRPIQNGHT
jgi:PAS domain S-box-containing protein